jgi:hypothetical protein
VDRLVPLCLDSRGTRSSGSVEELPSVLFRELGGRDFELYNFRRCGEKLDRAWGFVRLVRPVPLAAKVRSFEVGDVCLNLPLR